MQDLTAQLNAMRAAFARSPYPALKDRRTHLKSLEKALLGYQEKFSVAISEDFSGRSRIEVMFSEIYVSVNALRNARSEVSGWMAPRPRKAGWPLWPGSAFILPQPVGVLGVISPWNYPLFLTIGPLAGALAAGNRVLIKPSEFTPATSELLQKMIAETFGSDHVSVVLGDAEVGQAFSRLPFDHLLFTGSTAVGRKVMQAAAENLVPVTLELGGKSPAILGSGANLERAAGSIVYGKFLNAGQTCIAPDYILVQERDLKPLAAVLQRAVEQQYGKATQNDDYTAIINQRQIDRLEGYVAEARAAGVEVVEIGPGRNGRKFPPTLLIDPPDGLRVMRDEIFGPILPLKPYRTLDDAIGYVNANPRPLALYFFGGASREIDRVLTETIAGGVTVNDTLVHIATDDLPFGGVGPSGIGHYHGREGFDTFSKLKPVFRRYGVGMNASLRAPYGKLHEMMRRFLIG